MNIGICIQCRMGSSRMPKKVLTPIYSEKNTLDFQIDRINKAFPEIPIIIATSDTEKDNVLEDYARSKNVECYRGSENNVVQRYYDVAKTYKLSHIFRVCGDNPFIDTELIQAMIPFIESNDYVSYRTSEGTPAIKTHIGVFAELVSTRALKRVLQETSHKLYLEHVTNYIYTHPTLFKIKWIDMPAFLDKAHSVRLTFDTPQDYKNIQQVYNAIGEGNNLEDILNFIEKSEELRSSMEMQIVENGK